MLSIIVNAFWLIAPAYATNAFPLLLKGKKPLDFNHYLFGNRLLGDGKTIEGTTGGIIFGVFIGIVLLLFQPYLTEFLSTYNISLFQHDTLTILLLSIGAILGDIIGSFIKRRFSIPRGKSVLLLDQWDFLIFSIFLLSFYKSISVDVLIFLLIITLFLHLLFNFIAYVLKIKQVPW